MKWYEIEPKDRISFSPSPGESQTRTVLSVHEGWVKVWCGGVERIVFDNEITGLVRK